MKQSHNSKNWKVFENHSSGFMIDGWYIIIKHKSNETEPQFEKLKTLTNRVYGGNRNKILTVTAFEI